MTKEEIIKGIETVKSVDDISDISKALKKKVINIINEMDIPIETKINRMLVYVTGRHNSLPLELDEITDYIDGIPERCEFVTYKKLIQWISGADKYDEWIKLIYEDVKKGNCGFVWDW